MGRLEDQIAFNVDAIVPETSLASVQAVKSYDLRTYEREIEFLVLQVTFDRRRWLDFWKMFSMCAECCNAVGINWDRRMGWNACGRGLKVTATQIVHAHGR